MDNRQLISEMIEGLLNPRPDHPHRESSIEMGQQLKKWLTDDNLLTDEDWNNLFKKLDDGPKLNIVLKW